MTSTGWATAAGCWCALMLLGAFAAWPRWHQRHRRRAEQHARYARRLDAGGHVTRIPPPGGPLPPPEQQQTSG